jgi:hypothetical protein
VRNGRGNRPEGTEPILVPSPVGSLPRRGANFQPGAERRKPHRPGFAIYQMRSPVRETQPLADPRCDIVGSLSRPSRAWPIVGNQIPGAALGRYCGRALPRAFLSRPVRGDSDGCRAGKSLMGEQIRPSDWPSPSVENVRLCLPAIDHRRIGRAEGPWVWSALQCCRA